MKTAAKKMIVSMLAAVMAFSTMTISASAAAKAPKVPKSITAYTNTSSSITIDGLGTAKQKIVKSSIKSSNQEVVMPSSLTTTINKYSYKSEPIAEGGRPYESSSGTNSQSIDFWLSKPGTATVSFNIGKKAYKTTVKVLKYTNPVKSITLTGANNGKNFAALTKKGSSAELTLSKNTLSKAWLTVSAASGWKIAYAGISCGSGDDSQSYSFSAGKNASTLVLGAGTVKKGGSLYVNFVNTKNGATMYVHYNLK